MNEITLSALPSRVRAALSDLRDRRLIETQVLEAVTKAAPICRQDLSHLVGFAVSAATLSARGVPILDTVDMAVQLSKTINLSWSEKRWRAEHKHMSWMVAFRRMMESNTKFDLDEFDALLPSRFKGYLIRSSVRLGMEGYRQGHCVGTYKSRVTNGALAIAVVFVNQARWTVELRLTKNESAQPSLRLGQIEGRSGARPDEATRTAIYDELGVQKQPSAEAVPGEGDARRRCLLNLRRLLPVLEEQEVEVVNVFFAGSGDSGSIDTIDFVGKRDSKEVAKVDVEIVASVNDHVDGAWEVSEKVLSLSLTDAIHELVDDYLAGVQANWYDGDGGYGEWDLLVQEGVMNCYVNVNYTESTSEHSEAVCVMSGAELNYQY